MTPERLAEIRARAERVAVMEVDEDRYGDRAVLLGYTRALSASADDVPDLVAEVERLQARVGSCDGGCNYQDGPDEMCSLHGRPVAEVWQIVRDVAAERDAKNAALAQQVEKVRALHFTVVPADWLGGPTRCRGCGDTYPCPTIRALDT